MKTNEKYQEILKLHRILEGNGIDHELSKMFDGWQIEVPHKPEKGEFGIISAIEYFASYGSREDLIELAYSKVSRELKEISAYLTAEQAAEKIKEIRKKGEGGEE